MTTERAEERPGGPHWRCWSCWIFAAGFLLVCGALAVLLHALIGDLK